MIVYETLNRPRPQAHF